MRGKTSCAPDLYAKRFALYTDSIIQIASSFCNPSLLVSQISLWLQRSNSGASHHTTRSIRISLAELRPGYKRGGASASNENVVAVRARDWLDIKNSGAGGG